MYYCVLVVERALSIDTNAQRYPGCVSETRVSNETAEKALTQISVCVVPPIEVRMAASIAIADCGACT